MERAIIVKLHKDFEQSDHFPDIRKMVYFAFKFSLRASKPPT